MGRGEQELLHVRSEIESSSSLPQLKESLQYKNEKALNPKFGCYLERPNTTPLSKKVS